MTATRKAPPTTAAIFGGFVAAALLVTGCTSASSTTPAHTQPRQTPSTSSTAPQPATLREGRSVTYTDDGDGSGPTRFKLTLNRLEQMTSASAYGEESTDFVPTKAKHGQFVVLDLTVTDLHGPQDGFFFTEPYYVGADGTRLADPSPDGLMLKGYNDKNQDINQRSVSPGQHVSGNMVFDVPTGNGKIVIPNGHTPAVEIPLTERPS